MEQLMTNATQIGMFSYDFHYDSDCPVSSMHAEARWKLNLTGPGWWATISSHTRSCLVSDGKDVRYLAHVYIHNSNPDRAMSAFQGFDDMSDALAHVAGVLKEHGF